MKKNIVQKISQRHSAFGLIEIVIAVSIVTVALAFLFNVAVLSLRLTNDASQRIQAANLLEEGYEAIRDVRGERGLQLGLDNLLFATGRTNGHSAGHCLKFVTAPVAAYKADEEYNPAVSDSCLIGDGFQRVVKIYPAERDGQGKLTGNAAPLPADRTFLIEIIVYWDSGRKSENLKFYLTSDSGL